MANKKPRTGGRTGSGAKAQTRARKSAPEKRRKTSKRSTKAESAEARALMLADLERSGLKQPDVTKHRLEPLTAEATQQHCGQKRASYRVTYFGIDGQPTGFYRLRFTQEAKGFGKTKPKKSQRYWQLPHTLPQFYLAPSIDWRRIASDPSVPLTFTEGEKKAAKACKEGIPTIGLGGVWTWRSKKRRSEASRAELPDFDFFEWKERRVEIAYDSDIIEKQDVQSALKALASYLFTLGVAEVNAVEFPSGYDLDNYLAGHGRKGYQKLPRPKVEPLDSWLPAMNEKYFVSLDGNRTLVCEERWDRTRERYVVERIRFDDFKKLYMNEWVACVDKDGEPKHKRKGDAWLEHEHRRQYERITMSPGGDTPDEYNLWRGFAVEPKPGCCEKFKAHLLDNICRGNKEHFDYLMNWLAYAVQHPDRAAEVAVVLKGKQGTGKGIFARTFGQLFGQHFVHITNGTHLTGRFNSHLRDAVLLFADEAFFAGDKKGLGSLKGLITEPTIPMEQKFVDLVTVPNMLHVIMASNNDWVIPADMEERRFFVLEVADTWMQDQAYFGAIGHEMESGGLAALLHEMLKTDLRDFDIRRVPQTEALVEQKLRSLEPIKGWWYEVLCRGALVANSAESWGQAPTDALYEDYREHAKASGHGSHCGSKASFGKSLVKVLPPGWPDNHKLTHKDKHAACTRRVPIKLFPPLDECRKHFASLMRLDSYDWDGQL